MDSFAPTPCAPQQASPQRPPPDSGFGDADAVSPTAAHCYEVPADAAPSRSYELRLSWGPPTGLWKRRLHRASLPPHRGRIKALGLRGPSGHDDPAGQPPAARITPPVGRTDGGAERVAVPARPGWPGMFSECGLSRLVRIRPPDSHKAGEDTQDVAGPLRPSSPAGVINITPARTKSALISEQDLVGVVGKRR